MSKFIISNKKRTWISAFAGMALVIFALATLSCILPKTARAEISIENLPDASVSSDFVLGPGKTELTLKPGQSQTVNVLVTNRLGVEKIFNLEIEDFTGSKNADQTVILLGNDKGPYSLRDYIHIDKTSFVLEQGQRATVPVTISIPADAESGGKYGSLIVSVVSSPSKAATETTTGQAAIVTRLATLFFVTVPGNIKEAGVLKTFTTINNKKIYSEGPINFQIAFENSGNVHLDPYGDLKIKNIFGQEVGEESITPWYALPDSLRFREISWNRRLLIGRYTAILSVNRGYGNQVDTAEVVFYVFPWKLLLAVFVGLALVILFFRWVFSKFEFRRKSA